MNVLLLLSALLSALTGLSARAAPVAAPAALSAQAQAAAQVAERVALSPRPRTPDAPRLPLVLAGVAQIDDVTPAEPSYGARRRE